MKKSVKEEVASKAFQYDRSQNTPPVIVVSVVLKLFRRACADAYERGRSDGFYGDHTKASRLAAVNEIINGPRKKGKK